MTLKQRIAGFVQVGLFINRHFAEQKPNETQLHQGLDKLIEMAHIYNNWFIPEFVKESIINISSQLKEEELVNFTKSIIEKPQKTVAIICAGNIPMVAFHDVLCVLLSGNKVLIKLSSDDNVLLPFFLKLLTHYEPEFESQILFAEGKLGAFDAVIATGSNNTAQHFKTYFGKYPHIIRKNRTSIAVITGKETTEELKDLGKDIFLYFGLGCRNVSKVMVPEGYSFDKLFEAIIDYGFVVNNKKYGNNYDYHRAIYLLESMTFLDNNFLMVKESVDLHSPVGVLYHQTYHSEKELSDYLGSINEGLQCVVGQNHIPFGYSQQPVISDFADGVNTLEFLVNL
ncbi:MAG: acyl-CoA reductase [Bacteroidota bacterium]|nr:acyl-CoA reductase [Bacteroidota bacterium]MDP3144837.1 acyl-CoA reductase [Bacteroidota bacterium]